MHAIALILLTLQQPTLPPVIGRWDLTLTASDGQRLPSWLEVQKSGNNALVGRYVAVVGSARPIARVEFANDTLRFAIPPQWESGNQDLQVVAAVQGDNLSGSVTFPDGTRLPLSGVRAPALTRERPVRWGRPVTLFNGRDLAGWHPQAGENAKARAALDGRPMADEDDLRAVAPTVLTHRLVINFAAEAAGRTAQDIVQQLLKEERWQPQ